jgi:glycerol-3-phosphate dehydrogenase
MKPRLQLGELPAQFDLIIIGGGITGAGIAREAVRTGARVLLVEQGDFASGTSSWSSKLVHGGLRYLKNGQWRLTLESVRERQRLMREAPGLVNPQIFLMPLYRGIKPGKLTMRLGLWLYDRMAGDSERSRWLAAQQLLQLEPQLRRENLLGAVRYLDAGTDDARMVIRLILDSVAEGLTALNYVRVEKMLSEGDRIVGVRLQDRLSGTHADIHASMVINATGAWADQLPGAPSGAPKLRPLRGSHFVFPASRLPIRHAVSWLHPKDSRPIFAYPWEGAVVYGTTDLDHAGTALDSVVMSGEEAKYLLDGLAHQFPALSFTAADAISSYAGVRPIVDSGKANPSAESRESALWASPGLVNITGGKLTTFRVTARAVLKEAARQLPRLHPAADGAAFARTPDRGDSRLFGRLGMRAQNLLDEMPLEERQQMIATTPYSWAELRWAARHEQVVHLDDLLMRRTRIGLVVAMGGREILPRVGEICRDELGWDEARWNSEMTRYLDIWRQRHAPPDNPTRQ